jgi:hypothetical protein
MAATTMAMAATALTLASPMVNVLLVEAEEGEDVFDELVKEPDVGPDRVLDVVDAATPPGELVSAVFCAGSAMNPLAVQ